MLEAHGLGYTIDGAALLQGASLSFDPGRFHAVLGPNGAGKSTLLKLLSGLRRPTAGGVALDGRPLTAYGAQALARRRAVLSQDVELVFPIPAEEVVLMGRSPWFRGAPTRHDRDVVRQAIDVAGIASHARQPYSTLSGGERQKLHLARVLAQIWPSEADEQRLLFLDEPTSSLDVKAQIQLLDSVRALVGPRLTVVAILHDVNLTFQYADTITFLREGRVVSALADPARVSAEELGEVYGAECRRVETGGAPLWVFSLRRGS
jgi:iron complex transport system ATP-binding protein